jgi:lipoprotein-anchoring transpeptidase ErfK/SrfK
MRLPTQTSWSGGPMTLLVLDDRRDASGRRWLRVRLPIRPNDASGWISSDVVRLSRNPWRIRVSTRARTVVVLRDAKVVHVMRAVIGKPGTPTPHGLFAIHERARQADPGGFVGPWALHLTAHSDVLTNYGGGPGRVAIHGRAGASLLDPLGSARSHGCVRVLNGDIGWLARTVRVGTPVLIGD